MDDAIPPRSSALAAVFCVAVLAAVAGTAPALASPSLQRGNAVDFAAPHAPVSSRRASECAKIECARIVAAPALVAIGGAQPELEVTPVSVAFPETMVGNSASAVAVTLENVGTANLTITGIAMPVSSVFPVVTQPPALPRTLTPGQILTFSLRFVPTTSFDYVDSITVMSNDPGGNRQIPVSGPGRIAGLQVSPMTLSFGEVRVDQDAELQAVAIRNSGDATITIGGISSSSPFDFTPILPSPLPVVLAPAPAGPGGQGERYTFAVSALPEALGPASANIFVQSNVPGSPNTIVTVSGTGVAPEMAVSQSFVDFGVLDLQGSDATASIGITNTGTLDLEIEDIRLEETFGGPYLGGAFRIAAASPGTLTPGQSMSVDVEYDPVVETAGDEANLVIIGNGFGTGTLRVPLAGRAIDRHITLSSMRIEFEPRYRSFGEPSDAVLVVGNSGGAPLAISMVVDVDDSTQAFSILSEVPTLLEAQSTARIDLRFDPRVASATPLVAHLNIISDDDDTTTARVELVGQALLPELVIGPGTLDFGRVAVGVDPDPGRSYQEVSIANMNGERTFEIRSLRMVDRSGNALDAFELVGAETPFSVLPLGEASFYVRARADAREAYDGFLEFYVDQDPERLAVIALHAEAENVSVGGGGCSVGGRTATSVAGALLVLALVAMRRRRAQVPVTVLLLSLVLTVPAGAQMRPGDLLVPTWLPSASPGADWISLEGGTVKGNSRWAAGFALGHATRPLEVEVMNTGTSYAPITSRLSMQLGLGLSYARRYELTAHLQAFSQSGQEPIASGIEPASGSAIGDTALAVRAHLLRWLGADWAASARMTFPTASDGQYVGLSGPSATLGGIAETRRGDLAAIANLGFAFRPRGELVGWQQGNALELGVGASYQAHSSISAIAEVRAALGLAGGDFAASSPSEIILGSRYRLLDDLSAVVAVGAGLGSGVGTPSSRLLVMFRYSPRNGSVRQQMAREGDADADGIADERDACPAEAEDRDGFEDRDGCPDPDNDRDGVTDRIDRCRDEAEDLDGYADADGCPDVENDGDGVLDADDSCPREAEDLDGYVDGDGCPDADDDSDGIVDAMDQCPREPETINGIDDEDGCPDAGDSLVRLTLDRVELLEPIQFGQGSTAIAQRSFNVLGQVAATLRAHPEIERVEIGVHVHGTAAEGDVELSLGRARALREWLVNWGIAESRLTVHGYGASKPIVDMSEPGARHKNERVELVIQKRRLR